VFLEESFLHCNECKTRTKDYLTAEKPILKGIEKAMVHGLVLAQPSVLIVIPANYQSAVNQTLKKG